MPVEYTVDPDRMIVISAASGVVIGEEALSHQHRLKNDPAFRPDFVQLIDLTKVTRFDLTSKTIAQLTSRNIFNFESRRAIVAEGALATGLTRMMATYAEISGKYKEMRIFREREEAMNWLLPPRTTQPGANLIDPHTAPQ